MAPTRMPVALAIANVNSRTVPFSEISCARVVNCPASVTSKSIATDARSSPTTAPASASSVLSVRS